MAEKESTNSTEKVVVVEGQSTANYRLPNQNISEAQKYANEGRWFFDNITYLSTFYNRPLTNLSTPELNLKGDGFQPITKMIINLLYYLGEQPNFTYNYLTQNVDMNNYIPTWRNGQDMLPIIENMRGNIKRILNSFHFSVKPLSEKARGKRSDYYNNVMLEFQLSKKKMAIPGVKFNPSGTDVSEMDEPELNKFINKEYKDYMADLMVSIAEGSWNISALSDFDRAALYAIVCGWCGCEHYVNNGRHFRKILLPYQMIVDTRIDDNLNRDARFAGYVTTMTPTEIFHRYPQLNDRQRDEIINIARSSDNFAKYNTQTTNFTWWANTINQDASVTAVKMYWISPHFLDTREVKNKYGVSQLFSSKVQWDKSNHDLTFYGDENYTIPKVKEKDLINYLPREEAYSLSTMNGESPKKVLEGSSVYVINDIYKGTVLGNRYLLDFGLSTNIVEHPLMKYKPLLPIQVFTPNIVGGNPVAVVDRLKKIQNEIDGARQMRREMLGRAKGKIVAIYGWKFAGLTGAREFLEDAASMGVHVLKSSGEIPDGMDTGKPIDILDMTLDPNFNRIEEYIISQKEEMKEILSTSTAALGQVSNYVGSSTLQNSVAQSTLGQSSFIDGFIDYVTINMQYEVDVKKCLYVENPDSFDAEIMVGDEGVNFYKKVLPDLKHEDFLLELHVRDAIDDKKREYITTGLVQPYMQNIGNEEADVALYNSLELLSTRTFTEAKDFLEEKIAERIKRMNKKEKEAQQQQQVQVQSQQQHQEVLALKGQIAKVMETLEKIDRKGQWDMITKMVEKGMTPPQPPPASQVAQEATQSLTPQLQQ